MRALFFALIIASLKLDADPIGTTFTNVSCTAGTQTQSNSSACSIPVVIGQAEYQVSAHASASANGMPWTIRYDTSPEILQPPTAWSAYSKAEDYGTFATPGTSRLGRVEFDIIFGAFYQESDLTASIDDSTNDYGFSATGSGSIPPTQCRYQFCEYQGELPVLLGSGHSFTVTLGGSASAGNCQGGKACAPGGNAMMTFATFESDGTTPVPFSPVPEPGGRALAWWGSLSLLISRFGPSVTARLTKAVSKVGSSK